TIRALPAADPPIQKEIIPPLPDRRDNSAVAHFDDLHLTNTFRESHPFRQAHGLAAIAVEDLCASDHSRAPSYVYPDGIYIAMQLADRKPPCWPRGRCL